MSAAIDPALQSGALAAAELALNRALALSPHGMDTLSELQGCVFALHCTAPSLQVYLHIDTNRLRLTSAYEGEVTTAVSGQASDFAELASATDAAAVLINGNLALQGDSAPLITLQNILANLDVDWEAPLVDALGDVAGHQLANGLRGFFAWRSAAHASLQRQISEFIHEEARLCPPAQELKDFSTDVDALVQRVERLTSRAERLRKRLTSLQGQ